MEFKTIEQIKDDVAFEYDWVDWICFLNDCGNYEKDVAIDVVIKRYAAQFQDIIKKQDEHLGILHHLIDHIQNNEVNINDKIDRLINIALHKISKIK